MNVSSNKPSDSDREYLQSELTRLVGQGRLDLDTYQDVVDTVWSTDDLGELMRIRARFLEGRRFRSSGPSSRHSIMDNPATANHLNIHRSSLRIISPDITPVPTLASSNHRCTSHQRVQINISLAHKWNSSGWPSATTRCRAHAGTRNLHDGLHPKVR